MMEPFIYVVDFDGIEYDVEDLKQRLGASIIKNKKEEVKSLINKSKELIEPKTVYSFLDVSKIEGNSVQLENGSIFNSIILGDLLTEGQTIAPHVVTIGNRFDDELSFLSNKSILSGWILDKIGNYVLSAARKMLRKRVEDLLGDKVSNFGPGTGTGELFDLDQQSVLFNILRPTENIGVELTPSKLMVPRKSVSGIFASSKQDYIACRYCPKECESRSAPYKGEYKIRSHHDGG